MTQGAAPEKRAHPRKLVTVSAFVVDVLHRVEARVEFDTHDLSLGGAFLRSALLLEVGELLELHIELPGVGGGAARTIRARGRVVHVVREPEPGGAPGMGIAFTELSERDRDAVRAYLARD